MTSGGVVIGECPRRTMLRSEFGIEVDPPSADRLIMFEMGVANEDVWKGLITKSWDGKILCEEEIPIKWKTKEGREVTGRPDMVLADKDGNLVLGIEHKMVASVWTARDVLFQGSPNMKHVLQAAHYSWQLGIPYRLAYTQYVDHAVASWANKHFPRSGEEFSHFIDYNDKGDIRKIKPFFWVYEIEVDEKSIKVFTETTDNYNVDKELVAEISLGSEDIARYYDFVASMAENKVLGSRPQNLDVHGEKKNWELCTYCPLAATCDSYERDFTKWLEAVKTQEG